ncbi:MAG: protein kinase [Thermodesulfobacteriota bacterium]|nr:protein kinase [Thermodesulfobacteriota bacterium]
MASFQKIRLGKYILLDKLAVGGMAELYRAMITGVQGFEKLIAIKKILPHLASEEELVRSFIDEAKLAALLHHQNVVQIYDFGSLGESYFIAMEYLVGKDCRIIKSKSKEKNLPLELQNALFIVSRICAGLDYAHKLKDFQGKPLNLVHRDISPQNILITYEGDVKIVDFGIAKAASQTTMTQIGMIKGKVAYMSPEQAGGKTIDNRSDIFSCGILLYELVTGKRMFSGDTMHILANVRDAEFTKPEEAKKDLPEKLLEVLYKALEKEADQRYQTCGDMLTDLEECMHQLNMHPTAHGLSLYMKTLFADEIAIEELHLLEIMKIVLMEEEEKEAEITAPIPSVEAARPRQPQEKEKKTLESAAAPLEMIKSKKFLLAAISVTLVLVIGLITMISKKEEPAPPPLPSQETTEIPRQAVDEPSPAIVAEQPADLLPETPLEAPGTELYQQAMDALVAGQYEEAMDLFEKLLTQGPGMADKIALPYAEALLGQAENLRETDAPQAIALFEKSIHFDPESEQAHFQLGTLFMKQKDYARAIESYENVIELNPKFADTFFNLGFIYAVSKDYARAEEMFSRVVDLGPDYLDEALFNLALVQNKQGKKDESMANLERAVSINPENELAQNYLKKMQEAAGENQ